MSNGKPLPNDVTVNFYDHYIPSLKDGEFTLQLSQALTVDTAQTTKNQGNTDIPAQPQPPITQKFIVKGARFSLPPGDVSQVFPAAGSSGRYDEYLPQIVFKRKSLPWERDFILNQSTIPWVALLVFSESELPAPQNAPAGSQQNPNHATSVLLKDLLNPPVGTLGPNITLEDGENQNKTYCNVIDIPIATFNLLLPSIADLPFLAHTRQVNVQNKAAVNGQIHDGWYSSVIANRFAVPPAADVAQIGNIVHLVSLEGFQDELNQNAAPTVSGYETVRMVSLFSWTYTSQADPAENFRTLMLDLIQDEPDLQLHLPLPRSTAAKAVDDAAQQVEARLKDGYVPLSYEMWSGDQSFAWYRGPLSPVPVTRFLKEVDPGQSQNPAAPLTTSAAMIFEEATGIFDQSYAVAFQTGRSLALASAPFAQNLMNWRSHAHSIVDLLHERITSPVYSEKIKQNGVVNAMGNEFATTSNILDLTKLLDTNFVAQAFHQALSLAFYQQVFQKVGQNDRIPLTPIATAQTLPSATTPAQLFTLMQHQRVVVLLQHLSGLDNLGTTASALALGATSIKLNTHGTKEAIPTGTVIVLSSPDEKTMTPVVLSSDVSAKSVSIPIEPYAGNPMPAGSVLYVQDPNQNASQIVAWLAATALLHNVPFNNLVAHPSLLPQGSIRFFYLDQNWVDALLDGALSIGVQTGRDVLLHQLMREKLHQKIQGRMAQMRHALLGLPIHAAPVAPQPSGFLLRSQGVAGWPGLEIKAFTGPQDAPQPMSPLRLELLASDTLFALYPDVPTQITFTEPSEGLVFGTEDAGIEMRYIPGVQQFAPQNIGKGIKNDKGETIYLPADAMKTARRAGVNAPFNFAGINGLVKLVEATIQNNVPEQPTLTLTPASFAVQMVRVPEQMKFTPLA